MTCPPWPTFGEVLDYLRRLGYSAGSPKPGYVSYELPAAGSVFVFRDRDPAEPAREGELVEMRVQLTYRGVVSDEEFARFWARGTPRPAPATQPTA
ncbi:MAG: hypothetical protein K2P78_10495 [Gemmataceae bacterium]|nr:hypothetical protein [Gemmataceae bacterium]